MMKKHLSRIWWTLAVLVVMAPNWALAAAKASGPNVVLVADTRKLDGIMAWWSNMYNDSHIEFTLLTIIIVPVTGLIFGLLADVVMGWIGIDLKSRELADH